MAKKGRPTVRDEERWRALCGALTRLYPCEVSMRVLSEVSGIPVPTLRRMHRIASILPGDLANYFVSISPTTYHTLSPLWRCILDLHNYTLLLRGYDVSNLFTQHALLWGADAAENAIATSTVYSRDFSELSRITNPRFTNTLVKHGWPEPPKVVDGPIETDCPILANRFAAFKTVGEVHALLAYPGHNLPLNPKSHKPLKPARTRMEMLELLLSADGGK